MADKENKDTKPNNDNAAEGLDTTKSENNYIIDTENAHSILDIIDPNSPYYDPQASEKINEALTGFKDTISDTLTAINAVTTSETANNFYQGLSSAITAINGFSEAVQNVFTPIAQAITPALQHFKENMPSLEELEQFATWNFGYQLAVDELAKANNITHEQLFQQSTDADGETIPGSLLEQAEHFGNQFAVLMLEELTKDEYQGKNFLELFRDDAEVVEDGQGLEVKEGSLLDAAIAAVEKKLKFNLQLFGNAAALAEVDATKKSTLSPIAKPQAYKILNSKVVNKYMTLQDALTNIDADGQLTWIPIDAEENQAELIVRNATAKKKEVIDIVSLTYYGELEGKAAKIKSYDQSILNTICSLLLAGNKVFLVDDIYKTLTQKTKVTDAQRKRIKTSLDKLSGHKIRLDVSNELKENLLKIDDELIVSGVIEDNLLHFRTLKITTEKGTEKEAIEILAEPILLTYSKGKNHQIITEPITLLEMKCRADEETISIRDYLIKEIHQLKKGFRDNPIINYDNLLAYIGFTPGKSERTEKARITSEVITILDGFKDKGFIKGHKVENGQRNKVTGFKIIV